MIRQSRAYMLRNTPYLDCHMPKTDSRPLQSLQPLADDRFLRHAGAIEQDTDPRTTLAACGSFQIGVFGVCVKSSSQNTPGWPSAAAGVALAALGDTCAHSNTPQTCGQVQPNYTDTGEARPRVVGGAAARVLIPPRLCRATVRPPPPCQNKGRNVVESAKKERGARRERHSM